MCPIPEATKATPWTSLPIPRGAPPARLGPVAADRGAADSGTDTSGATPTCLMRVWCSGGGPPPSGDVLFEEAIFKSESEPPPLERLSSGVLDILRGPGAGEEVCVCARLNVRVFAGLRIRRTVRCGPGSSCADVLSNVTVRTDCQTQTSWAPFLYLSLLSGMLTVCHWMPARPRLSVYACVRRRRERASHALPWNSAGSMPRSGTVGNLSTGVISHWKAEMPVVEIRPLEKKTMDTWFISI